MSEHLVFRELPPPSPRKTLIFGVYSKPFNVGDIPILLGQVSWHAPWRRYVFFPGRTTLFDVACLTDIIAFINDLMWKRKELE